MSEKFDREGAQGDAEPLEPIEKAEPKCLADFEVLCGLQ